MEPREEDIRGPFFRDHTAIIHSLPFRRLKHKAQVFFSPNNDHVCTRIEHSLHVATIAATISRGLGLDEQNEVKFKQPKTPKSRRSISLLPLTVDALRKHKKEQAEEKLLLGKKYRDMDLVCALPSGEPMKPGSFSKAVPAFSEKIGLPRINLHGLRHSHASHLFRLNKHPKMVSERLGHSGIGITQDLYTHMLPGIQEEAAFELDAVLKKAIDEN